MMSNIKEYFEYRRNRKAAKREIAKLCSTALPVINGWSAMAVDLRRLVGRLANASKDMTSDELFRLVLSELANMLSTNEGRLVEIFTYLTSLTPDEMHRILVNAMVETNPELKDME